MSASPEATTYLTRDRVRTSRRRVRIQLDAILIYAGITIFTLIVIIPVVHVFARSFSPEAWIRAGLVFLWPVGFTTSAYKEILNSPQFLTGLRNSVIITGLSVPLQMTFTTLGAYALSRPGLPGRRFFMYFIIVTMVFPPGLIPFYLNVRTLGLIDTYWAVVLPYMVNSFDLIVLRSFFQTMPVELEEAAAMDGASQLVIMTKVYLPLAKPALATIFLFYFVQDWNMYLPAIFFITDGSKAPLQPVLRDIIFLSQLLASGAMPAQWQELAGAEAIKGAAVVLTALPIFAVYPFVQKYFTKGLTIGAIKG